MVQGSMTCVKYLMFIFNFVFVVCGIVLIVVGGLIFGKYYTIFLEGAYLSGPAIIIGIGIVIFIIAFLGCCGAIKENSCMVSTFGALLLIIFVVEVAGGIAAYVFHGKLEDFLQDNMKKTLVGSKKDEEVAWNYMQKQLKCCGVNGSTDYTDNKKDIPPSCCGLEKGKCAAGDAYAEGCYKQLYNSLKDHIFLVFAVAIGVAVIELIGVMFACCLSKAIKNDWK